MKKSWVRVPPKCVSNLQTKKKKNHHALFELSTVEALYNQVLPSPISTRGFEVLKAIIVGTLGTCSPFSLVGQLSQIDRQCFSLTKLQQSIITERLPF